jgi:hypothetical protein
VGICSPCSRVSSSQIKGTLEYFNPSINTLKPTTPKKNVRKKRKTETKKRRKKRERNKKQKKTQSCEKRRREITIKRYLS